MFQFVLQTTNLPCLLHTPSEDFHCLQFALLHLARMHLATQIEIMISNTTTQVLQTIENYWNATLADVFICATCLTN